MPGRQRQIFGVALIVMLSRDVNDMEATLLFGLPYNRESGVGREEVLPFILDSGEIFQIIHMYAALVLVPVHVEERWHFGFLRTACKFLRLILVIGGCQEHVGSILPLCLEELQTVTGHS